MRLFRFLAIALPSLVVACASLVGFPDVPDIEVGDGGDGADSSSSSGDDARSTSGADSPSSGGSDGPSSSGSDGQSSGGSDSAGDGAMGSSSSAGSSSAGSSSAGSSSGSSGGSSSGGSSSGGGIVTLTVTARVFGPGSGTVTSGPAGISCTAPCTKTASFPVGTSVTLTASGGPLVWWAPGTKCKGSTCPLTLSSPATIMVTFSGNNFVFTSSRTHDGNMGGVAGGDALCAQVATTAGLPGTFISWLGTSTSNPLTRLSSARGWIRPDGLPFVDLASGLKDGQILYPPAVNEQGQPEPSFFVYTGANVDGTIVASPNGNCNDFTNNSAMLGNGGASTGGTWVFTSGLAQSCSGSYPVYCFGTDLSTPVTFTPATGRHVFLSKGLFSPSSNVSAADSLCQGEAMSAGLANPTHFLAMLATTTATAASRFNLSGANWVRPDGIPVTSTPSDVEQTLLSGISIHADGTYASNSTLTGAFGPPPIAAGAHDTVSLGTVAGTCNDYSTSAGYLLAIGWAGYTASSWFNFSKSDCSLPLSVFCFEN